MYAVLGGGLIGPSVAYGLSVLRPDSQIILFEKDKARMERAKWLLRKLEADNVAFFNIPPVGYLQGKSDVTVISTFPYSLNLEIASKCIQNGWRYYDLGGHIQTSEEIARRAMDSDSSVPVMTDLGLAPGLVNLLGEYYLNETDGPISLDMFCGGLPTDPEINELNYGVVFSPEGLINEYFNNCEILHGGRIIEAEPMGDLRIVTMGGLTYEAFNTSGGAHTTLEVARQAGAQFCRYQTLRYMGHSKIIRFLKNDIGMTNKQLASLVDQKVPRITQDKVLIGISTVNQHGAKFIVDWEFLFNEHWTAMQRTTGFTTAGVVAVTEEIWDKPLCTYKDVDTEKLVSILNEKLLPELEL